LAPRLPVALDRFGDSISRGKSKASGGRQSGHPRWVPLAILTSYAFHVAIGTWME
jgi:hypothetical protein